MATVTKPIALDESFNTTEVTPRNIADVLAEGLSHITGRTASEVEYDNTDSGLTADNVQDALDEIAESVPTLPTTDIQTAVDEFETYNGGLLSECKVTLEPVQDLHGYPNPWVGGAGKNLLPNNITTVTVYDVTYETQEDGSIEGNGTSTGWANAELVSDLLLKAGTYILSGTTITGAYISVITLLGGEDYSITGPNNTRQITFETDTHVMVRISAKPGTVLSNAKYYPMIRLATESDSSFEPYSNICPISGHTQVDVEVGTNKLNPDNIVQGNLTTSAVSVRCSTRGNLTIPISVGQTITVSRQSATINFALAVTDSSMSVLFDSGWQSGSYTYVSAYDGYVELVFSKQNGTDVTPSDVKAANFMVEFGSTPSTYVPYTKGTYSLTVNLGGTYYSGTLDVVSGVFEVTNAILDLGDRAWIKSSVRHYTEIGLSNPIRPYAPNGDNTYIPTLNDGRCTDYVATSRANIENVQYGFSIHASGSSYITIRDKRYDELSGNDFKAAISGVYLCYKLATPQTIQLSPTMVKALVGENHLSAPLEGQEITESKYKQTFTFDDVNAQIESTYSEGISHNSVYRGKYLGDHVTDEQWDAIGDGSFRDLYIGDYWTINGINWRIAHFNYWLGTGDVKCNTNHVVIVPYGWVSTFNMNASDDTTGGYLNSEWYTTNRHFAVENIEADFGASHILSHRNFFSDAVSDGHASHGMWVDSTVDLMNEIMVCGSLVGSYLGKYYEVGCDKLQLALFKYNPPSARMDVSYWLRGVSSASSFVAMGNFGLLDGFTASQILKIRPVFAIKK